MVLRALEAWPAIFGGLIPILGLVAIGLLIHYAVRRPDDDDDDEQPPT